MLLKKYSAQWERMRLADQSILFQEAWRCCLNNYFCRRVAMRSIGISDTLHTRLTTFEQNICRVRKKNQSIFVVKFFDSECHWVTIVIQYSQKLWHERYTGCSEISPRHTNARFKAHWYRQWSLKHYIRLAFFGLCRNSSSIRCIRDHACRVCMVR